MITLCGILVCIAPGGCAFRDNPMTVIDECSYRLVSKRNTYFVHEPFRLALHVKNLSNSKQELPPVLSEGYELHVQGPGGNEDFERIWMVQKEEDRDLLPGELRVIELPRELDDCCFAPGDHRLGYRYFGTESGNAPKWETSLITIECVEQPLVIPEGTDKRVKKALRGISGVRAHLAVKG